MTRLTLAVWLASIAVPGHSGAQVQFRTETVYVELQAFVTGQDAAPVRGLSASDFDIREGDQARRIARVEEVASDPAEADESGDVASNRGARRARKLLLLLDDWHVDPSTAAFVTSRLRAFVAEALGPADYVGVVFTSGTDPALEFIRDRPVVFDVIGAFQGRYRPPDEGVGGVERSVKARRALAAIRGACEFMRNVEGPRAILLVSEGWDYDLGDQAASLVADRAGEARRAALEAGIPIYAWDPGGLRTPDVGGSSGEALRGEARTSETERRRTEALREITRSTGGGVIATNDPRPRLLQLARANGHHYLIGYYSSPDVARDASIEVHVRRDGATVRTRRVSAAPSSRASSNAPQAKAGERNVLNALLSAPVPDDGIAMRAQAVPVGPDRADGRVAIAVIVDVEASGLALRQVDDRIVCELVYAVSAVRNDGRQRQAHGDQVTLRLPQHVWEASTKRGVRLVAGVEVQPGSHYVRFALTERPTGRKGSVFLQIEIPPRRRGEAWMASLVLVSPSVSDEARALTMVADGLAGSRLDVATVRLDRQFEPAEEVHVMAIAYGNPPDQAPLSILVRNLDRAGSAPTSLSRETSGHGEAGLARFRLPLGRLGPGRFSAKFAGVPAGRGVIFRVTPG